MRQALLDHLLPCLTTICDLHGGLGRAGLQGFFDLGAEINLAGIGFGVALITVASHQLAGHVFNSTIDNQVGRRR
ncbi:hypothetical protein D3C85_1796540 [compost metagenome]